jgi:RNA polymerase-binding protein DksA
LGQVATQKDKNSSRPQLIAPSKVNPKWSKNYRNLLKLRDQLLKQIHGLSEEASKEYTNYSMHMADSGTDSFDRDFALSLLSSDRNSLHEIEDALKRIEEGTYGICELTGKPISKERLEAIPWARFSIEAQRQIEQEGAAGRAHLGELGTVQGPSSVEWEDNEEENRGSSSSGGGSES